MIQGQALTFETFGLNKGVMTMRDRETGTVWTQLDGKAISGQLSGERLTMIPMPQMTWGEWITNHPIPWFCRPTRRSSTAIVL